MLQKFVRDSPLPGVTAAGGGQCEGLGRMAGPREVKGHVRAWRRGRMVKTGENSQEKGREDRGAVITGLIWVSSLLRWLAVMIIESLSYIQSPERIIYSYLSSGNSLQTLVGTRYRVLGTQVFLVILKQRKVWWNRATLAAQGCLVCPQTVCARVSWEVYLCSLPSMGRHGLIPERIMHRGLLSWYKGIQFHSIFSLLQKKGTGHGAHRGKGVGIIVGPLRHRPLCSVSCLHPALQSDPSVPTTGSIGTSRWPSTSVSPCTLTLSRCSDDIFANDKRTESHQQEGFFVVVVFYRTSLI